jgi:Acyl-CoA dehydrogenase, N-terminal domain.
MRRDLYEPDHEAFREVVQTYVKREVTPNQQRWEQEHIVDRQAWLAAGKQAIIGHLIRSGSAASARRISASAAW